MFGVKVPAIIKHLRNTFEFGELREDSVISILETTATDGKNYSTRYYSLDANALARDYDPNAPHAAAELSFFVVRSASGDFIMPEL